MGLGRKQRERLSVRPPPPILRRCSPHPQLPHASQRVDYFRPLVAIVDQVDRGRSVMGL